MIKFFAIILLFVSISVSANSSMRRCTLLPITDSVGGAIGFKVFTELEKDFKRKNWCTYVSNSSLISVFSRYRENLPQHLKTKEVLSTVATKLQVGSVIRVAITNEINGVEVQMDVYGEDGVELYFSEKTNLRSDDVNLITATVGNWMDSYVKMIPYDAMVTGVLGDQVTLDVGKGHAIRSGQKFTVKKLVNIKRHPLLKKVVDWDTAVVAEGNVFNVSDNQALGQIKLYKNDRKVEKGNWVRLQEMNESDFITEETLKENEIQKPGTLGLLSLNLLGSQTNLTNGNKWSGPVWGFNARGEGWITRQYFAALELTRGIGTLKSTKSSVKEKKPGFTYSEFKLTGGYKYLPIGFFYGPQIDIYGGYANKNFDVDVSEIDGLGQATFSGLVFGIGANVPINREFRVYTRGEFLPFPTFKDEDGTFGSAKSVSSLELEFGLRYNYTIRTSIDFGLISRSNKAKLKSSVKELSYKENALKLGTTINF